MRLGMGKPMMMGMRKGPSRKNVVRRGRPMSAMAQKGRVAGVIRRSLTGPYLG